jgi:hypothetical protein
MSGGSLAPIENSPPGIQTMPSGADPGSGVLLATVGSKVDEEEDDLEGGEDADGCDLSSATVWFEFRPYTVQPTAIPNAASTVKN